MSVLEFWEWCIAFCGSCPSGFPLCGSLLQPGGNPLASDTLPAVHREGVASPCSSLELSWPGCLSLQPAWSSQAPIILGHPWVSLLFPPFPFSPSHTCGHPFPCWPHQLCFPSLLILVLAVPHLFPPLIPFSPSCSLPQPFSLSKSSPGFLLLLAGSGHVQPLAELRQRWACLVAGAPPTSFLVAPGGGLWG